MDGFWRLVGLGRMAGVVLCLVFACIHVVLVRLDALGLAVCMGRQDVDMMTSTDMDVYQVVRLQFWQIKVMFLSWPGSLQMVSYVLIARPFTGIKPRFGE